MPNAYLATVAANEAEAREVIQTNSNNLVTMGKLVHTEPAEEEGELPTFVFDCEVSSFGHVAPGHTLDMLHDHYFLPNLPNLPIGFI